MANCKDLKPSICGSRGLDIPKDNCDVIRIEGADDVELNQGVCIDLRDGVHAYDGDGTEIPFTVSPTEIGCCDVGEHEVTYTAMGKGNKMLPSVCLGKPILHTQRCGLATKVVTRLITILQALQPKILGAVRTYLPLGSTFNPMDGISGIDDNGKATEVTFEGRYDVSTGKTDIAQINSDIEQSAKSLKIALEPIQDLNGYDKPWVGGAGKNKLPSGYATTQTKNGVTFTINEDGTVKANGTATATTVLYLSIYEDLWSSGSYILNGCPSSGGNNKYCLRMYATGGTTFVSDFGSGATFTGQSQLECAIVIWNGQTVSDLVFEPMIRLASETDATYEPYSNICPISGRTEVETVVSPTTLAEDGTTYTTSLGRTVYGGTLDVVSGVLTVDRAMVDLGTLNWTPVALDRWKAMLPEGAKYPSTTSETTTAISSTLEAVSMITLNSSTSVMGIAFYSRLDGIFARNGSTTEPPTGQLCYELAQPQTYQLTPQQIDLLLGANHLWSDGEIDVVYSEPLVDGSNQMDIWGVYPITYHTEDSCGNETTVIREVIVGDCDEESRNPIVCQGKLCCMSLDCSEELPVVCQCTVCNAKTTCSQTEITPQEV